MKPSPLHRSLVAATLLLAACGRTIDVAACSRSIEALVPEDAIVVARATSLAALQQRIAELAPVQAPPTLDELFARLGARIGDHRLIDRELPCGVALSIPGGIVPTPVLLLPTTDAVAYAASLSKDGRTAAPQVEGAYVAVPLGPSYKRPAQTSAFARDLMAGTIAVRADVAKLYQMYRGFVDLGLDQAEKQMVADLPKDAEIDLKPLLRLYLDGIRVAMESVATVDLALGGAGTSLALDAVLHAAEGSPMDGWAQTPKVDAAQLLRALPREGAIMQVLYVADLDAMQRHLGSDFDFLFLALLGATSNGPLQQLLRAGAQQGKLFEGGAAIDMRSSGGGRLATTTIHRTDPGAAALQRVDNWFAHLDAPNLVRRGPIEATVGGIPCHDYELAVEPAPAADSEASRMLSMLVGGDGTLRSRCAQRDDTVWIGLNLDDAGWATVLAAPAATAPSPLQAALDRVAGCAPLFVQRMDFAALMRLQLSARRPGEPQLFPEPPAGEAPVTMYAGIQNRDWRFGVTMDLQSLVPRRR